MSSVVGWGGDTNGELAVDYRTGGALWEPSLAILAPKDTVKVQAPYFWTSFLTAKGEVFNVGTNEQGTLANGTRIESTKLVGPVLKDVVDLACAGNHGLAIVGPNRQVYWWGNSGIKGEANLVPAPIAGMTGCLAVYAGGGSLYAVFADRIMVWGENRAAQLGNGEVHIWQVEPVVATKLTPYLSQIAKLYPGGDPTVGGGLLIKLKDGTGLVIGANGSGQGGIEPSHEPIKTPKAIGLGGIEDMSRSVSHSLVLAKGVVYVAGSNDYGEHGLGDTVARVGWQKVPLPPGKAERVYAGLRVTIVQIDGKLYSCGWGQHAMPGLGNGEDVYKLTHIEGLEKVREVNMQEFHAMAIIDGPAPAPVLTGEDGVGKGTVKWRAPATKDEWRCYIRVHTGGPGGFTGAVKLPPTAHEHTFDKAIDGSGGPLKPGKYDLQVRRKNFMSRTVTVTVT